MGRYGCVLFSQEGGDFWFDIVEFLGNGWLDTTSACDVDIPQETPLAK